jgi:integrase
VGRERDRKTGWYLPGPQSFEPLLKDPLVSDWIRSYQKSKTREDYARALQVVLRKTGLMPKQLLKLELPEARKRIMDIVRDYLDQERYAVARQIQTATKSFFEIHDKQLVFKKAERIKKIRKKIAIELIPSKEQVYSMANYIRKKNSPDRIRTRAIFLCLFQSGVRVGCLCKWTIGMVRSQLYPTVKAPVYLKITNQLDTKLSGYGLDYYYTFLQHEATEALREYLDLREKAEGPLKDSDLIFGPARRFAKNKHTQPDRILMIVKAAARAIGLDPKSVWTHTLRKSFRKVLNATPDLDEDTKEALMGHSLPGSRGNYFDVHDIDEIASKYVKADFGPVSGDSRVRILEGELGTMRDRLEKLESIYSEKLKIKEK